LTAAVEPQAAPAARAAVALAAVFALFGALVGTWLSRIPAVKDSLSLDNRTLGLALLGWPIGSVVASAVVPRVLDAFGSRRVVLASGVLSAVTLMLLALAGSALALAGAGFVFGLATGALDIAANTHAVAVEAAYGRSIFSRLHACWSAGAFLGAAGGAIAAAAGLGVRGHFAVVATVAAVAMTCVTRRTLLSTDAASTRQPSARSWSFQPVVLSLGVVALAGFIVEASVGDWAAVYLHDDVGTSAAVGAAGYATFAAVHLSVRFRGDRLITRSSRVSVMIVGCVVAAAGYAIMLSVVQVGTVFVGLAVIAAGIAAVVPAAFSAAGQLRDTNTAAGVATVTGISYVGWATAPPVIGLVAGAFTLRTALLIPLVAAGVGAVFAGLLRSRVTLDEHVDAHPPSPTPR
jgi:MFS family permease